MTWLSLAANFKFAIFFGYSTGADVDTGSMIALIIILLAFKEYFVLENFLWQQYHLYMFTPLFVLIIALIESIQQNWNASASTA